MTKDKVIEKYNDFLLLKKLNSETFNLYINSAKKFLNDRLNGHDISCLKEIDLKKHTEKSNSRKKNLQYFKQWLLDNGMVNFDRYQNKNDKTIDRAIEEYIRDLRLKHITNDTLRSVSARLNLFLSFLADKDIFYISEISKSIIISFIQYLHMCEVPNKDGRAYSRGYKAHVMGTLKDFFNYLRREQEIMFDPSLVIVIPKMPNRLYQNIINIEELNQLESEINTDDDFGFRDLSIIETLYGTGMRVGEISNMLIEDTSISGRNIMIRNGKGKKDRVVPLNKYAVKLLNQYIKETRRKIIKKTKSKKRLAKGIVYLNIYGKKMSEEGITRIIQRYGKKAGIEKNVTAHTFRHSCATHMLTNGADVRYIQKLLGHKSLSSTQVYTKVMLEELKNTIEKYHPYEGKSGR